MIHYFYHHDYPSKFATDHDHNALTAENTAQGVLAVHSKMYAMGEKYQIPGLKALAVRKYGSGWLSTSAGFNTAIVIAYMSTPETDRHLREVIVDILSRDKWLAKRDVVCQTVKEIPELLYDLYRRLMDAH